MLMAVLPVTRTSTPAFDSSEGSTSLRRRLTSCVVSSACGPELGTTNHWTAVGFSGSFGTAGEANTTSSVLPRAVVMASRFAWSTSPSSSATRRSGPLKPAPKPSTMRS